MPQRTALTITFYQDGCKTEVITPDDLLQKVLELMPVLAVTERRAINPADAALILIQHATGTRGDH